DKLVLPDDQRELLNILTTDISVFTGDIIDGKSAGNVILAMGRPGVGKTLTAEVYAEATGRPLYSIHSGSLGVTAELVRKNLEVIFDRAKRWDAVLLLDEADVFVME
ncbi:AAA family ATPase, partial [Streptomyces sp. SID10244]|nr:AAA family ATPase [Streptomyces sp. SID10244]